VLFVAIQAVTIMQFGLGTTYDQLPMD